MPMTKELENLQKRVDKNLKSIQRDTKKLILRVAEYAELISILAKEKEELENAKHR